jgi:hypothetical protein
MHEDMESDGDRGSDGHRESMSVTMPSMFPSMEKGEIVGHIVIDVFSFMSTVEVILM